MWFGPSSVRPVHTNVWLIVDSLWRLDCPDLARVLDAVTTVDMSRQAAERLRSAASCAEQRWSSAQRVDSLHSLTTFGVIVSNASSSERGDR